MIPSNSPVRSLTHRPAKRFLLVDDHPIMSDALRYTLESIAPDCKIEFAASYGEARRILAEGNRIDCILLDLGLPDSDGYDALQGLRLLRPDTPVVVLSADGERETIMRCLNLVAHGTRAAMLLLAHVDKASVRGGAGLDSNTTFSGSTAWNNSARSRWAMVRDADTVVLRHEKIGRAHV